MKSPQLLPTLTILASLSLACKQEEPAQTDAAGAEENLGPPVKAELPPPPDFDEGRVDETYPDGAHSIYGLRRSLDERVKEGDAGTEIMVRGWIQDIYVPPECPEGEICAPAKQPHVWITDKPEQRGKKRAMMVVNYRFSIPDWDEKRWKDQPDVLFEKGKQYTIKGKFKRFSDTGFSDARGLLEFVSYRPLNPETGQELGEWVAPPAAPWHPIEVQRQEEENAALAKKAAATAQAYKDRKR